MGESEDKKAVAALAEARETERFAEILRALADLQQRLGETVSVAESSTATMKMVGDCLMENTQVGRVLTEELRADRMIDHQRLDNAVRVLESSAKRIDALTIQVSDQTREFQLRLAALVKNTELTRQDIAATKKEAELARKNAYDGMVAAEALSGQLETPLKIAAEAAKETATHTEETKRRVKDMTGQFETFSKEQLAKAEEEGKAPKEKFQAYWLFLKAFSNLPLSTRIMATIMVVMLAAVLIAHSVEGGK